MKLKILIMFCWVLNICDGNSLERTYFSKLNENKSSAELNPLNDETLPNLKRHENIKSEFIQTPDIYFTSYGPSNSYGPHVENDNINYIQDLIESSNSNSEPTENLIYDSNLLSHDQHSVIIPKSANDFARYYKFSVPPSPSPNHYHQMSHEMMEIKDNENEKQEKKKKGMIELFLKKIGLALTTKALFKIVLFKAIVNMIAFGCLIYSVIGYKSNSENYSSTTLRPIYSTSNEDEH